MAITITLSPQSLAAFGDEATAKERLETYIKQATVEHAAAVVLNESEAELTSAKEAMDSAIEDYQAARRKQNADVETARVDTATAVGLEIAADESVTITTETIK